VPALSDMTDELAKIDPASAENPLINPPAEMQAKLKSWAALTDEQTLEFNTLYAAVTGG
jgi:spermidine/putrescine transport system substrate-binding protein